MQVTSGWSEADLRGHRAAGRVKRWLRRQCFGVAVIPRFPPETREDRPCPVCAEVTASRGDLAGSMSLTRDRAISSTSTRSRATRPHRHLTDAHAHAQRVTWPALSSARSRAQVERVITLTRVDQDPRTPTAIAGTTPQRRVGRDVWPPKRRAGSTGSPHSPPPGS